MQKLGYLANAAAHFERALALNPDNLVAQVNLECNQQLQTGRKSSVQASRSIQDEFGKKRNWDQVLSEYGPFDEPNRCYEQGFVLVNNNLYRQGAAQFNRVRTLAPENLAASLWLAQLYIVGQQPGEALKLMEDLRAQPDLADAVRSNRTEMLFVEASARLGKGDLKGAEATVGSAVRQHPDDENLLATATQVYLNYRCYTNALGIIDQELKLAPTNLTALVNKGVASIQIGAFDQAIPALTRALALETNNHSALLNRAIAYLRANKLEAAQRDYETLQKAYPTAFQINFGLAEIAWQRKDTNAAIRNYQLYLANAPTNTAEAKLVSERLKQLKPRSS